MCGVYGVPPFPYVATYVFFFYIKDVKYGFGGKKRANKRNTSESVDDIRSFSSAKHNKSPRAKTKVILMLKRFFFLNS